MKDFFEYKWKYILNKVFKYYSKGKQSDKFLFVTHEGTIDWILGAKARRLSRFFSGESEVVYSPKFKNLPHSPGYFFLHQRYFAKALRYNPFLKDCKTIVMFTHPEWNKYYSKSHAKYSLNQASKVICLNRGTADELISIGVEAAKVEVYHMASDPEFFQPKLKREGKTVGFCCAYYDRKNPELIYNLVMQMDDVNFVLVGQSWEKYSKFDEMLKRSNFKYYGNRDYKDYPTFYREMDVFVSPSYLEGGPVPLLEAMLSNIVPVASDTGFCPDIIRHGENGFLFDPYKDPVSKVADFIRQALKLDVNVRTDVIDHSWSNYGSRIFDLYKSL